MPTTSHRQGYELLLKKRVQLWAVDEFTAYFILKSKSHNPSERISKATCIEETSLGGVYMAFSKQTDIKWVSKFRDSLQKIKISGKYNNIVKKYR